MGISELRSLLIIQTRLGRRHVQGRTRCVSRTDEGGGYGEEGIERERC